MAFPTSPTNGQQYTVNGTTYQWNNANGTWDKVGTSAANLTAIFNGNSNVLVAANSNVTVSVAGNANVLTVTGTGIVANLTGNVTGNLTGFASNATVANTVVDASQPNITSVGTLTSLTITGNANVGNIGGETAVLTVAANVPLIQNGNSNISVDANSHVRISANGTANIVFVAANGNVGIGTATPTAKFDLSGSSVQNVVAVAASAIDCSAGNYFTKTASGALTWTFTNVPASRSITIILELTNGGTGTQTWPASVKWPSGIAPTLTASGVDVIGFITDDSGTTWRGVALMIDSK